MNDIITNLLKVSVMSVLLLGITATVLLTIMLIYAFYSGL